MTHKLKHDIPSWVADDAVFFITVCCKQRHVNSLAKPEVADKIRESLAHRQSLRQWWTIYALAMPDHFHTLFAFRQSMEMRKVMTAWKRFHTHHSQIEWQDNFFDHRIRSDESLDEKIEYIRHNPVRQGLVAQPEDWHYAWTGDDLERLR
jgi:REP element-mobilizing transposase RayT